MSRQPTLEGRCSTCRRALLWVSGRLRCCNPQCPGHNEEAA